MLKNVPLFNTGCRPRCRTWTYDFL